MKLTPMTNEEAKAAGIKLTGAPEAPEINDPLTEEDKARIRQMLGIKDLKEVTNDKGDS
jgi:hypothetical protein